MRPGPWLVGVAGAGLAAAGVALFWRTNTAPGHGTPFAGYAPLGASSAYESRLDLQFDDRWAVVWTTGHLAGLGLLGAGLVVLTGLAGWSRGRARPAAWVVPALGAAGAALVVGGCTAVLAGGAGPVVTYSGSYQPLVCPDGADCWGGLSVALGALQVAGLGMTLTGTLVVAAVAGRLLRGDAGPADGDEAPDLQ
ncbi:membrane protein of unknown function [Modestobacter italicus]|uniref:Uncharacterized protein n=1 Tax=Modestobacter italicus (strain DSM 44449 / CECT 9708 / BC 501) TaxID=2732864 RepID=I4EZB7_MODI5|nr:hypothetical protein [Modestobacter marinus]CCH88730.1 membrane protein of unknown function [Modestobacter marinus]